MRGVGSRLALFLGGRLAPWLSGGPGGGALGAREDLPLRLAGHPDPRGPSKIQEGAAGPKVGVRMNWSDRQRQLPGPWPQV